jgi:phospholipid transport system substrate-binding protein
MNSMKCNFLNICVVALLMLSSSVYPEPKAGPYEKIEQVTAKLLTIIDAHKEGYPDNQQQYFNAISNLLNGAVDFKYISKKVMGAYRSKVTAKQRSIFVDKFRQGLVETYGRGIINYGNQKIVIVDRSALKDGQRTLIVKQEIRSEGDTYPLEYSMARKKTGEWMVINMTISGINLRQIFQSQFIQAAKKSGGDLDVVIANWTVESK